MTEKMLLAPKFRPKRLRLKQAKTCPSWEWAFQPLGLCAVWLESWMCRLCSHQGLARESLPAACKQSQNKSFATWKSQTSIWTQKPPAEIHLWCKHVLLHATVWDILFSARHGWSIHLLCVAQAIFGQHDLRSQSSCFSSTEHSHEAHCEAFCSKLPHLDPLGAPMSFSTSTFLVSLASLTEFSRRWFLVRHSVYSELAAETQKQFKVIYLFSWSSFRNEDTTERMQKSLQARRFRNWVDIEVRLDQVTESSSSNRLSLPLWTNGVLLRRDIGM